jgi:ribosomal protein L11 methyltransferase
MILWRKQAGPKWLAAHQALLEEFAPGKVAIIARPGRVRGLVEVFCHNSSQSENLLQKFGGRAIKLPRNWLALYQPPRSRSPLRIGRRLQIVSEPTALSKHQLIIPFAGAFGTGEHATTAMSLRLLERATRSLAPGWRMLDAGTGTGILAFAAVRFGAGRALGLDHDAHAVAHARHNAQRNRIRAARFVRGDVLAWRPVHRYDFITANLFSELLIAALPIFRRALRAKGLLIVSGILREQSVAVERALRRSAFHLQERRRRGKWVALLCGSAPPL